MKRVKIQEREQLIKKGVTIKHAGRKVMRCWKTDLLQGPARKEAEDKQVST